MKINHSEPYAPLRHKAYPSVEDQLDMIWKSMDSGQAPIIEPFYSRVRSVKIRYPKPAGQADKTKGAGAAHGQAKIPKWVEIRARRDGLLRQSDWTQLPDVPPATKEAWAIYRQALRDVTLQIDPFAIDWPVAPT